MTNPIDDRKRVYVAIPTRLQHTNVMVEASRWMAEDFPWQEWKYHKSSDYSLSGALEGKQRLIGQIDAVCVLPLVNDQIAPDTHQEIEALKTAYPEIELFQFNRATGQKELLTLNYSVMSEQDYEHYTADGPNNAVAFKGLG
jgi:hypothetical protein